MTKLDIVNEISDKTGIDRFMVSESLESFFKVVKNNISNGKNIYIRGFGTFLVKKRAKKVARNISKNTFVEVGEHFVPKFKPSKIFVDKVKKNIPADFTPEKESGND